MASSCKRRPHHSDHGKDRRSDDNHHHHHHHRQHHDRDHNDQQPHPCNKNSSGNRFTTSSRRLMQFHINSSSLTLAAVFMLVAVLLMPHQQVLSAETGNAEAVNEPIDYTTEFSVQPTTITISEVKISKAEISNEGNYNDKVIKTENGEQQSLITKFDEGEYAKVEDSETSEKHGEVDESSKLNENDDSLNENIDPTNEAGIITIITHNSAEINRNDGKVSNNSSPDNINANVDSSQTVDNDNIAPSAQPVDNDGNDANSPQTVNNEDNDANPPQTIVNDYNDTNPPQSVFDVDNDATLKQPVEKVESEVNSPQTINKDGNTDSGANSLQALDNDNISPQSSTTPTFNNESHDAVVLAQTPAEKPTPSIAEDFNYEIPLHVEEPSVVEHLHQHHSHQSEVNNDIFSTIVEVSPEIKTSPDFIDSQPGKAIESTENLEQSIRNSVKTEIELQQNLESSPVLEILKDIAEPDIRQTLTEDLIENDMAPMSIAKEIEENHNAEQVETKKDQSEQHVANPVDVNDEPEIFVATLDESSRDTANSRGARNLEVQTSSDHQNETAHSSSSSSSSSFTSSSSSQSNSEETSQEGKEEIDVNETAEEDKETEVIDESEKPQQKETQNNETHNDENEQVNNAEEEFDKDESEADLNIPETSQELHVTVTTPISDIALIEGDDDKKASAELDEALSVVLNESLSSTAPNIEEESLLSVEQKEQKTSLDTIAAEEEEATVMPEESEHIVIKKVLDEQEIFPDVSEETTAETVLGLQESEATAGVIVEEPHPTIIEIQTPASNNDDVDNDEEQVLEEEAKKIEPTTPEEVIPSTNALNVVEASTSNEDVEEQDIQDEQELLNISQAELDIRKESELAADVIVEETANDEESAHHTLNPEETSNDAHDQEEETDGEAHNGKDQLPNNKDYENSENIQESQHSGTIASTTESPAAHYDEPSQGPLFTNFYFVSTTEAAINVENHDIVPGMHVADTDNTKTVKGSRSVNRALIADNDDAATIFEAYPPHDSDQTFNGNLADESAGIGKALPVTINNGSTNRSTVIIILSSGTAVLFIAVSVTIFLISFQRQHGTLDIEMQERSCGKDNLNEEDAETFAKLLEVELPPSVAIALEETEECL